METEQNKLNTGQKIIKCFGIVLLVLFLGSVAALINTDLSLLVLFIIMPAFIVLGLIYSILVLVFKVPGQKTLAYTIVGFVVLCVIGLVYAGSLDWSGGL